MSDVIKTSDFLLDNQAEALALAEVDRSIITPCKVMHDALAVINAHDAKEIICHLAAITGITERRRDILLSMAYTAKGQTWNEHIHGGQIADESQ